ncbi:MAG: methyl-accepting chemotaxis protein [Bdellovibrionota bacterium]
MINRPFQLRFSLYVCSWLFALSLVYPLIIYNLFLFFLRYIITDPHSAAGENLIQMRQEVMVLLVTLQVIFLAVTFLLSMFTSHRIAGPLHKLKNHFRLVKTGALDQDVRFRKRDHFGDVADGFNEMVHGLRNIAEKRNQSIRAAMDILILAKEKTKGDALSEIDRALLSLKTALSSAPKGS